METQKVRRYDLDWLRVMVFSLLIIYHVGMFFVNWDWHIKNNVINYDLGWPMAFINRWRLHILFVISGMGTFYALSFRSSRQFIWERIKRLGIPLIFGMLVIVPPQVYYERLTSGAFSGSYFNFLTSIAFTQGSYPEGNISWHHLWFLPYLLIFSLVLVPVFLYIRDNPGNDFTSFIKKNISKRPWMLFLFILPLYCYEAFLEPLFPTTHALIGDWFTLFNFITLFFYGFILISLKETFWEALDKIKGSALICGIISFTILYFLWPLEDTFLKHFVEAFIYVLNTWSWILTIFGYAAKYKNKKTKWLAYSNRAVYPFYILHQTVIIIIAYYIKDLDWSFLPKFMVLTVATFLICWIIYDLIILKLPFLHPFLGLKKMINK